jgi:predicted nucleotidyltransferase
VLPDVAAHRAALQALRDRIVETAERDPRLLGVAIGGSWRTGRIDAYSDLDVVLVAEEEAFESVMADRKAFAAEIGGLLAAFTAEHVGEPRMVICLYGPEPLLHCDLKFLTPSQLAVRVEDPVIEWERDGRIAQALATAPAEYPAPDAQWIEDRFWVWLHYGATKLARGELLEVQDMLPYLRGIVLGPLELQAAGLQPTGVRRMEQDLPEAARRLAETVAGYDAGDCARALVACADQYRALRGDVERRTAAERAATAYLADVSAAVAARGGRTAG